MKVFAYRSALCRLEYKPYVTEGRQAKRELMNTYVVVGQQYYYIDANTLVMCSVSTNGERASLANLKLTIGSLLECS